MKKFVAVVVSLVLLLCLAGCSASYSSSDIKEIKQKAYSEGYEAGRREGSGGDYDEGYDAGWDAAMRDVALRELDEGEDPTEFSGHVEWLLDDLLNALYDAGLYNDEEYCEIFNELYGYVIDYNESH